MMTMIFDFLKKIFGWVDEGSKKRKLSHDCDEREYVTPKKFKGNCHTSYPMEDYFNVDDSDDDDITYLGERKCSLRRPCGAQLKSNHHEKQSKPYRFHSTIVSPVHKSSCSSLHCDMSAMEHFVHHKHKTQDNDHKCPTLCKTNQLRERHQYEELLHNFLPNRIRILKEKNAECASRKPIEVIDLEKCSEAMTVNKIQSVTPETSTPSYCRRNVSNYFRTDREKGPVLGYNRKDTIKYSQPIKVITIDRPNVHNTTTKSPSTSKLPIEAVATNSLRDELSAKAVMRQDFIPQVAKRYNERIEQRHKEAEELKKMTCVLSKHNRYVREAALEEQLTRSMRLCMAVLDDREEPEEPSLPVLTDKMTREVKAALAPGPPNEVLAEGFGLRITRKDLHTLAGLNWLNDEVINFYMNLLIARSTASNKYPKVHAMNTFFYPKLLSGGHSSLRRWTRKVDIFAQDLVVVPIHLDIHWCMSIVDLRDKTIVYYDSMGGSNQKCLMALKQYLQDESLDKKKQTYDMNEWKFHSAKNIPQQMNGSDCGVFSCMFAEYICANKKITFTQEDMQYFRNKMVYEILKGQLL